MMWHIQVLVLWSLLGTIGSVFVEIFLVFFNLKNAVCRS